MKVWLCMRIKHFENAKLPDNVLGVLPVYKTIDAAKRDGVKRVDLKRMIIIGKIKLFEEEGSWTFPRDGKDE